MVGGAAVQSQTQPSLNLPVRSPININSVPWSFSWLLRSLGNTICVANCKVWRRKGNSTFQLMTHSPPRAVCMRKSVFSFRLQIVLFNFEGGEIVSGGGWIQLSQTLTQFPRMLNKPNLGEHQVLIENCSGFQRISVWTQCVLWD